MPSIDRDTILRDLTDFIAKGHGTYALWYCGITPDIPSGLFQEHNVGQFGNNWKWREAVNEAAARWVEKSLRALGCKGAPVNYQGGERVYVYKISPTSIE